MYQDFIALSFLYSMHHVYHNIEFIRTENRYFNICGLPYKLIEIIHTPFMHVKVK